MAKKKIIIGTRGSKLALIYANIAKNKIFELKDKYNFEEILIQNIKTQGDEVQNVRLSEVGGKGLFSKKIEDLVVSIFALVLLFPVAGLARFLAVLLLVLPL